MRLFTHAHAPDVHPIAPFSPNPDFDFEIRCVLGAAVAGGSDVGEVLAATAGIAKNDHEAWFAAWKRLGERVLALADGAASGARDVSAASAYLRASTYLAVAVNAVSALVDSDELGPTFAAQQKAWRGFTAHTSADVEPVTLDDADGTMPGWLFRAPGGATGAPTLIAVNGSDGSLAALWSACVAPALDRGYNVLIFDGPGQQSQLFENGIPFRPDWEHVLTPVFDAVAAFEGVESDRIALYGISQGSYWVARALAFEHRFAAAVVDPGLVDVSTSWTSHLPKSLLAHLDQGETEAFDREMQLAMRFSEETARTWRFRARPYGTTGYAETIQAVRRYTVADVAASITTPLLILDPENEQFWPGQAERLAALTPAVSTVARFTAEEGADGHCQPLARTLTAQRMFDWLDERLARD